MDGNALVVSIVRRLSELRNTIDYFIASMALSDFIFPFVTVPVQYSTLGTDSEQFRRLIFCKL